MGVLQISQAAQLGQFSQQGTALVKNVNASLACEILDFNGQPLEISGFNLCKLKLYFTLL